MQHGLAVLQTLLEELTVPQAHGFRVLLLGGGRRRERNGDVVRKGEKEGVE